MIPEWTQTATPNSPTDAPNASDITHVATIPTDEEFEAERWRQINELLVWSATMAAAGEMVSISQTPGRVSL